MVADYHNGLAAATARGAGLVVCNHSSCWPVRPGLNVAGAALSANRPAGDVRHRVLLPQLVGQGADGQDGVMTAAVVPDLSVEALRGDFSEGDGAGHLGIVARRGPY